MLYFDHNATTPLAPEVARVLAEAGAEFFGNPSSIHRHGQRARLQLEKARKQIAESLGTNPAQFVFTSGGTESNNLGIIGLLRSFSERQRHAVTSTIEHPAVSEALRAMQAEGVAISYAEVDANGVVDVDQIQLLLRPETVLVTVMHANNETGALQPIQEIGELVRSRREAGQEVYLHSDGVQALGKLPLYLGALGVDLYSVSAHKIFAPKGVGGLYVRAGVPLTSIHFGGRHERNRRAGTENVAGAMAFAKAAELCHKDDLTGILTRRKSFESSLLAKLGSKARLNGPSQDDSLRLVNTSNIEFPGISAEALAISLDLEGIAVSTGSACSSGSVEASHVLLAMGRSRAQAKSSMRFSFGRYNTDEDVKMLVEAVAASVERFSSKGSVRIPARNEAGREQHVVVQ